MKKKYQNWLIAGFLAALFVVGYLVVAKPDTGGWFDLSGVLENNSTEEQTSTPTVAVQNIAAAVGSDASVKISFSVVASEGATVQNVSLYYALNVADPSNATYNKLTATKNNDTYTATVSAQFGDVVYYYIEVIYLANNETKTYKTEVYTLTVTDTYAPTLSSVSIDYNSTAKTFAISFNATDNDQIAEYIVHYAENSVNDFTNTTFSLVNATTTPITISNITEGNYYAFWFEVKDLSGNVATLFNETSPFVLQANSSSTWPVEVNATG